MNRLRLKHAGEKMGIVQTILRSDRRTRQVGSLTGNELAQLFVDIWTLPQTNPPGHKPHPLDGKPSLRPGEDENLLALIYRIGQQRYGPLFDQVIAQQYMLSLPKQRASINQS